MSYQHLKNYRALLTDDEHLEMVKCGMTAQLKESCGSDYRRIVKMAQIGDALKVILASTIFAGVPAGILWHKLDRVTAANRPEEKEMQEKIKFYKHMTTNIENAIAESEQEKPYAKPVPGLNV